MSISTYFRPNIHQNGPEILGVKIQAFVGGIGVPKHGEPLKSTGARLLNHQTSKISINSILDENFFVGV
jgi:hypothetical protein